MLKTIFNITTFKYSPSYTQEDFEKWELPNDYHCIYILENGKDAYVGETLVAAIRAYQHISKFQALNFQRMHIITSDLMEETPAKHYERLLIRLMKVDRLFNIVNGTDGNKTHYQRKNEFELHFDKLWNQLIDKKLVKQKSFQLILNSNAYKYSPYITFTKEQTDALTHIVNVLNSEETAPFSSKYKRRPVLINGNAGTGKTVVATSLFHYLRNDSRYANKKIAMVVANEQMRNILKDVFHKTKEGLKKEDIISPIELTKQKYDIIICDEVHALRRYENLVFYKKHFEEGNKRLGLDNTHNELDWILEQSEYQILFYDEKQIIKRSDVRDEYIKKKILDCKQRGFRPIELKTQMRNKGGDAYIDYIYDILYQRMPQKQTFDDFDFKLFSSFTKMREEILQKEDKHGLSKLCGGYAWKWVSKDDISKPDIIIEGEEIRWNRDKKMWIGNIDSKREMGSVYTLRGLDLNYVGLVIGPDLYFDKKDNQIKVNKKNLFSNDVKKGATDGELKEYVLNTYALLLTRSIKGAYLYVCNDALREYLKCFIEDEC